MARPKKPRNTRCKPGAYYFKPRGIPMFDLEEISIEMDELEALKLSDFLAHSQEEGAKKMGISRATFGRIIEKARKKIVEAILQGKAIKISDSMPEGIEKKKSLRQPFN